MSATAPAQRGDAVGQAEAGRDHGAQAHLALPVRAVDARGGEARRDPHEVVEAHEVGRAGRDVLRETYSREIVSRSPRSFSLRRSWTS